MNHSAWTRGSDDSNTHLQVTNVSWGTWAYTVMAEADPGGKGGSGTQPAGATRIMGTNHISIN